MKWRIAGGSLRAVVVALIALALAPALAMADVEPNDGIEQAEGPLAGGTDYEGALSTDNDNDWYFFYVPQRAQMTFTLDTGDAENDCGIAFLRNTDGYEIREFGTNENAEQVMITLDPGRYLISVELACDDYRMRIDPAEAVGTGPAPAPAIASTEPNDTAVQAFGPMAHGQPYSGAVETVNDDDFLKFFSGAPGPVNVSVTNTGDCDIYFDVDADDVIEDDLVGSGAAVEPDRTFQFSFTAPRAREYLIKLTGCVGATYHASVTGVISNSPPPGSTCGDPEAAGYLYPAKMRVGRARVLSDDRRLDVFAPITSRAQGPVTVTYQGDGRLDTFNAEVSQSNADLDQIRFRQPITRGQARLRQGIVTIFYGGDEDTRPEEVRLRAASNPARLSIDEISLLGDRLSARGGATSRAEGIVRFRFSYLDAAGNPQVHLARATIQDNGDWALTDDVVPPQLAQCGGYLSILFTGYFERRVRGEMLAYQLFPGQVRQP